MTNEELAREWLDKAGLGDVRYGCADMCNCERCRRTLTALLTQVQAEARLAALNQAAEHRPVYDDCGDIECCVGCDWKCPDWGKKGDPKNDVTHWMEHIAALEHQVSVNRPSKGEVDASILRG